jgi:enediyne biosynthesis protein E4
MASTSGLFVTALVLICSSTTLLLRAWTPAQIAAPIQFRNLAEAAGLDFVLENSPTPRKHLVETMAGGVAAFDYDGDGRTDIYFTNGAALPSLVKDSPKFSNRLYRNLGGLKFKDVTTQAGIAGEGYSMAAAVGDYDNDGHPDLFVAGVRKNILYRNRGDGTFEDITAKARLAPPGWITTTTGCSIFSL